MLGDTVEFYVDYLVVKSRRRIKLLGHLKVAFDKLHRYQLKINPLKCTFRVTLGKFLGFVIRHRGIKLDLSKIKVIIELSPLTNI